MIDGTAIKELATRIRNPMMVGDDPELRFVAIPNDWKVVDQSSLIAPGPTPEALKVYSLGALRDYLKANRDALPMAELVVHVVSPQVVRLSSALRDVTRHRETYVEAAATNLTDGFLSKFMAIEEFIVGLQTRFVASDATRDVLKLFGNVKHEQVKTSADDGITQTVSAKVGVVLSAEVPVPNPVALEPFRTFREVLQPVSPFVLRVNSGRAGGLPEVGLFEADGGAWRLTAVDRIRDWLKDELPADVAVLA